MSNRRAILDYPRNEAGLVDEFLGTAFDAVYAIYQNLQEVLNSKEYSETAKSAQIAAHASELAAAASALNAANSENNAHASEVAAAASQVAAEAAAELATEASVALPQVIAARDAAEAYSVTALNAVTQTQADVVLCQAAVVDAESAAENVVGDVRVAMQSTGTPNTSLFFRSKHVEVGFRDDIYDSLISTYGYTYLYPQQFCIDSAANELWILKRTAGGTNTWGWVWVYDLTTLVVKTVFSTGEAWKECLVLRTVGPQRFMYTIGASNSVIRFDVTTLPTQLSTPTVESRYSVNAYSQMAWDGEFWYVQDSNSYLNLTRRNRFNIYNEDFSVRTGSFELPLNSIGTIQGYIDYFPHMQALCVHKGTLYASVGGAYVVGDTSGNADKAYYLQGLHAFTLQGEKVASALVRPDKFATDMTTLLGYPATCSENEGVGTNGEDLFALWVTLSPAQRVDPAFSTKGVVITLEASKSESRVDFSSETPGSGLIINPSEFKNRIQASSTQILNPVTREQLTSFPEIIAMMQQLGIDRYSFGGTNQTIKDMNGASVSMTGRLVTFTTANGFTFFVSVLDVNGNELVYGISGTTQLGPFNHGGEFGSTADSTYFKHSTGELTCVLNNTPGLACTITRGAVFSSDAYVWTYPVPFVGERPFVGVNASYGLRWGTTSALPGLTATSIILYATAADSTARPFQATARGRWK